MSRPQTPPEAALIAAALKRSGLSQRAAAAQSGMSDARWRQIVTGYQSIGGTQVSVVAPAETLARMARTVDVTPGQLEEAGRMDAAEALSALQEAESTAGEESPPGDPQVEAIAALLATLPPEAQDQVLRLHEEQRRQAQSSPKRHAG